MIIFEVSDNIYSNDIKIKIKSASINEDNLQDQKISDITLNKYLQDQNQTINEKTNADLLLKTFSPDNIKKELHQIDKFKEDISKNLDPDHVKNSDNIDCANLTLNGSQEDNSNDSKKLVLTQIKDTQDNLIAEVSTKKNNTKKTCNDEDSPAINILNNMPKIEVDFKTNAIKDGICELPENSPIKKQVRASQNEIKTRTQQLKDVKEKTGQNIDDTIENYLNLYGITKDQLQNLEQDTQDKVKDTLKPKTENTQGYGIPVLQINLEKNIIIQILDEEIQVLNFNNTKFESTYSTMDLIKLGFNKNDYPETRIIPGIKYVLVYSRNMMEHKLQLLKEGSTNIYTSVAHSTDETGLFYLGMDKAGLKHFCGKFYKITTKVNDNIDLHQELNSFIKLPKIYGALAFYDFYNKSPEDTRIIKNKVYPYNSDMNSISMREEYTLMPRGDNNYTFMKNGVIDDIYCKNNLLKKSFTISLWVRKYTLTHDIYDHENNHRQVLLSDIINNNTLYYNQYSNEFVIEFFGTRNYLKFRAEDMLNNWVFVTLKFSRELHSLQLSYHYYKSDEAFQHGKFTTDSIYLNLDHSQINDFHLISIFGEKSKLNFEYINKFKCISGPIIIYDNYKNDKTVLYNFNTQYKVLHKYYEF